MVSTSSQYESTRVVLKNKGHQAVERMKYQYRTFRHPTSSSGNKTDGGLVKQCAGVALCAAAITPVHARAARQDVMRLPTNSSSTSESDWPWKSTMKESEEYHHCEETKTTKIHERPLAHGSYLNMISETWLCLSISERLTFSSLHTLDPYYAKWARTPYGMEKWCCDVLFGLRGGTLYNLKGDMYQSSNALKNSMMRRLKTSSFFTTTGVIDSIFAKLRSEMYIPAVRVLAWSLSKVFRLLFDGIHVDGGSVLALKERLRKAGPSATLVLLPTHKTHLDYLILSFVCFAYGIPLPRIAAGNNLNLPLVGPYLRQNGSFFIERSFKKQPMIYKRVVEEYLKELLHDGAPIEVFIEGGRSRHGRVCDAKLGFLNMLNTAFQSSQSLTELLLVPVSLDYERVLETSEYARHSMGCSKEPESLCGFLQALYAICTTRLGNAYVRFGNPVTIEKDVEPEPALHSLGTTIAHRMQLASTITCSTLTTACLLMPYRNAFRTLDEVSMQVDWILEDLQHTCKCFIADFAPAREMTCQALDVLDTLIEKCPEKEMVFRGRCTHPESAIQLAFYRNQLLHVYLPQAVLQCVIVGAFHSIPWSKGHKHVSYSILYANAEMLWNFMLGICQHPEINLHDEILLFIEADPHLSWCSKGVVDDVTTWVCSLNSHAIVHPKISFWRTFRVSLLWPFLDSFYLFLQTLSQHNNAITSSVTLMEIVQARANQAYQSGTYHYAEYISKDHFQHALSYCITEHILLYHNGHYHINSQLVQMTLCTWSLFQLRPSRIWYNRDVLLQDIPLLSIQ